MRLLIHDIRRSFAYATDDLNRAARTLAYPFTSRARDWKYRRDIRLGRAKPPEPITEATLAEAAKALREVYKMIAMQEHADVPRGTSTTTRGGKG